VAAKAHTVYLYTFIFLSVYLAVHEITGRLNNDPPNFNLSCSLTYLVGAISFHYLPPKYSLCYRSP
jgi:hypothetical protein